MKPLPWSAVEVETMSPVLSRQAIHTERLTIARIQLKKGAVVPRHSHNNEQVTLLEQGRLRFFFDDRTEDLMAGEVMAIPPDAAHKVEALEDSVAVDLFAPGRSDWLRGDDAYLRG
jgi:quercetin dioxygenase-like cupin family protein